MYTNKQMVLKRITTDELYIYPRCNLLKNPLRILTPHTSP